MEREINTALHIAIIAFLIRLCIYSGIELTTVRIPQTSSDCSGKSSSLVFVLYNEKCDVVSLLLHCPQMLFYLREDQSPGSSILSLSLSLGGMIGEKYID